MPSSSTSQTSSSVGATNPQLAQLFTQLFSGSTMSSVNQTLQGIMSGQQMQTNTGQLYKTLQQASQPAYQQGMAQVNEQAARSGLSNSSSLTGQMGSYTNQYLNNLSQVSTQMGLQETQLQAGTAGNLMQMLSSAGSQYYTNQSSTTTSMPWTSGFSAIMGAATGLIGAGTGASAWSSLFA